MLARLVVCVLALSFIASAAVARPQYAQKMYAMYPDAKNNDFAKKHGDAAKKRISCSICHVKEGIKSNYKKRNNYGFEVGKSLTKKNEIDKKKIEEAISAAEKGKSATDGKTFGDLIAAGERPGTNDEKK